MNPPALEKKTVASERPYAGGLHSRFFDDFGIDFVLNLVAKNIELNNCMYFQYE